MKYYTGIGSRDTPVEVLNMMKEVSKYLASIGYILRSGAAKGADSAFENGCNSVSGSKEIYLPWSGFNNSKSKLVVFKPMAFEIAEKYHPYWHNLKQGAKKLQARNSHQIFGKDLKTPSEFVLCYTKNGNSSGGTGQSIRMAMENKIPVFDFGDHDKLDEEIRYKYIKEELLDFLEHYLNCDVRGVL